MHEIHGKQVSYADSANHDCVSLSGAYVKWNVYSSDILIFSGWN